jgi:hypothetical protein
LELALNEKQIPRFVRNNRKRKQEMESVEGVLILAKQVLSWLKYWRRHSAISASALLPDLYLLFVVAGCEWL